MGKKKKKKKKKKISAGKLTEICVSCGAKCCTYFALEIDEPDCPEEYEKIRWYLAHTKTWVFTDDGKWYLMVLNECEYLGDDMLCTNYENRPAICRDHTQDNCERKSDNFYDELFKTTRDFEDWLEVKGEKYW
jgi:hypothetical protein